MWGSPHPPPSLVTWNSYGRSQVLEPSAASVAVSVNMPTELSAPAVPVTTIFVLGSVGLTGVGSNAGVVIVIPAHVYTVPPPLHARLVATESFTLPPPGLLM